MLSRLLVVTLLGAGVFGPVAATAQGTGCSCEVVGDTDAFEQATHVFRARAIAPVELVIPEGSDPADGWSFVVTGVAKGQISPEQLVAVPPDSDRCAVTFEREVEYLLFATDDRADLPAAVVSVGPCSGSRPVTAPFDGSLVFAAPRPIPVDPDSFPVVADPLEQRAKGDVLTARALIGIVAIIGITTTAAIWLWRTRPDPK